MSNITKTRKIKATFTHYVSGRVRPDMGYHLLNVSPHDHTNSPGPFAFIMRVQNKTLIWSENVYYAQMSFQGKVRKHIKTLQNVPLHILELDTVDVKQD